jgi:hypothetical protein
MANHNKGYTPCTHQFEDSLILGLIPGVNLSPVRQFDLPVPGRVFPIAFFFPIMNNSIHHFCNFFSNVNTINQIPPILVFSELICLLSATRISSRGFTVLNFSSLQDCGKTEIALTLHVKILTKHDAMVRNFPLLTQFVLAGLLIVLVTRGYSQEQDEKKAEEKTGSTATFSAGADLVSRYIWRGADYGNSPAIQPAIAFSVAGFKAGFWGSYGLGQYSKQINDTTIVNMGHYAEFDMYLSYTLKGFTLMACDYFFPNPLNSNSGNRFYNFNPNTTGHTLELSLSWAGPEKFPVQLYAGTLVYGADKGKDSTGVYGAGSENNYSTYFEAAYLFNVKGFGVKPFIGMIPFGSSWYGPYGGVINGGCTISKSIVITKNYSLPVFGSVITNPQAESVFLLFGITF